MERATTASLQNLNLADDNPTNSKTTSPALPQKKKRRKFFQTLDLRSLARSGSPAPTNAHGPLPSATPRIAGQFEDDRHDASVLNEGPLHQFATHQPTANHIHSASSSDADEEIHIPGGTAHPELATPASKPLDLEDDPEDVIKYLKIRVHELESLVAQKDNTIKILKHELQHNLSAARKQTASTSQQTATGTTNTTTITHYEDTYEDTSSEAAIHSDSDLSDHAHVSSYSDPRLHRFTPKLELELDDGSGTLDITLDSIQADSVGGASTVGGANTSGRVVSMSGESHSSVSSTSPHNSIIGSISKSTTAAPVLTTSATTTATSHHRDSLLPHEDDDARFDHVIDKEYYAHDNSSFEILGPYSVDMGRFKSRNDPMNQPS